jgi:hypothetical protein
MIMHSKESDRSDTFAESISRKRVVNILNYVDFREKNVVVNLRSVQDGNTLSLRATPEPCQGEVACLKWFEETPANVERDYEFVDFLIDKGQRVVVVTGQPTHIDASGIGVLLPAHCQTISRRRTERFGSAPVHATLSNNESTAMGTLQDFGGGFLKIRAKAQDATLLENGGKAELLRIALHRDGTIAYEGEGSINRRFMDRESIDFVLALAPCSEETQEGDGEAAVNPALIAICRHPLSDKIIRLHVGKISYNTFVLKEDPARALLFPGLIIHNMRIDFGAGDSARCVAKVVAGRDGAWSMSILDMPIPDQRKLFSFVEKEAGKGLGASAVIDPEDLIEFFFEAGFIYPQKYASLVQSREQLKAILSRLYIDTPSISQHFVEYDGDSIQGHICMVRFYERAWVVQHHTAVGGAGAGSAVLAQIFRYIHSYSAFPSTGIDYAMTYYRPENRFPDRVLGGLARSLDTPELCSIDAFSYLHLRFGENVREAPDKSEWLLEPGTPDDLLVLKEFYERVSGGLTLKAFGLDTQRDERPTIDLDSEFGKAGLLRKKLVFSLRNDGKLKAVMMVTDSDAGLNMSNLMKCVHVFMIDGEGVPSDLLLGQLDKLSHMYEEREIPVLLFPSSYAKRWGVAQEKTYNLLVFHVSVGRRFIEFIERLTNRTARRRYGALGSEQGEEGESK